MNIDHKNLRYISGPVSVIKLEGTINKTKKEILIFHYDNAKEYNRRRKNENNGKVCNDVPI